MYCESEMNLEVRYYETDKMGIVHHSNYIRYFECARHQFLADIGTPVVEIERRGIELPVVNVEAHYLSSARMGDTLRIVSKVVKEPMARIEVLEEIYNQNNKLLCEGKVTVGFLRQETGRPTRVPSYLLEALKKASRD